VVVGIADVSRIRSQNSKVDVRGFSEHRLGLRMLPLGVAVEGEVVVAIAGSWMMGSQRFQANGQRALDQGLRLRVLVLFIENSTESVGGGRGVRVIRAEPSLPDRERFTSDPLGVAIAGFPFQI